MRLHNQSKGSRVAIRECVHVYEHKTVNTYDLVVRLGKGKRRAMMLKHALEKALRTIAEEQK